MIVFHKVFLSTSFLVLRYHGWHRPGASMSTPGKPGQTLMRRRPDLLFRLASYYYFAYIRGGTESVRKAEVNARVGNGFKGCRITEYVNEIDRGQLHRTQPSSLFDAESRFITRDLWPDSARLHKGRFAEEQTSTEICP